MKDYQELVKVIIGIALILASGVFGVYLCFWVMLYGGIMQAVENWGVNNSIVVLGIIKAVFFEIGLLPSYFGILIGMKILDD